MRAYHRRNTLLRLLTIAGVLIAFALFSRFSIKNTFAQTCTGSGTYSIVKIWCDSPGTTNSFCDDAIIGSGTSNCGGSSCTRIVTKYEGKCKIACGAVGVQCCGTDPIVSYVSKNWGCTGGTGGGGSVPPTPTPYHLGCGGSKNTGCVRIAGNGSNTCFSEGVDPANACSHTKCDNGQCSVVAGGNVGNQCGAIDALNQHACFVFSCSGKSCVKNDVNGTGNTNQDQCGAEANPAPACSYTACNANTNQCEVIAGMTVPANVKKCGAVTDPQGSLCGCSVTVGQPCGGGAGCCIGSLQCVNSVCKTVTPTPTPITRPPPGCAPGQTDPHRTCSLNSCVSIAGCGTNACTLSSQCIGTPTPTPPPQHNACGASCVCRSVRGSGRNECNNPGGSCTPAIPSDTDTSYNQGSLSFSSGVTASPNTGNSGFAPTVAMSISDELASTGQPTYSYTLYWTATNTVSGIFSNCTKSVGVWSCTVSLTAPAGVYTNTGTSYPIKLDVVRTNNPQQPVTASHTTYVQTNCSIVNTPTPAGPTPTPTPLPDSSWIKLLDTSFAGVSALNNPVPQSPASYDNDDPGNPYFIDTSNGSDPGEVVAPSVNTGRSEVSSKKWKAEGINYTPQIGVSSFISYVKSRKNYAVITRADLQGGLINKKNNAIYYVSGDQIIDNNGSNGKLNKKNVVIIVDGTLTISVPKYNNNNDSGNLSSAVAILVSGDLILDPKVNELNGIFIVDGTINTGSTDSGLKVNGNLIAQGGLVNQRSQTNKKKPSVFIKFDPTFYLDLLPYLSTRIYDWNQIACVGGCITSPSLPTATPIPPTSTPTPTTAGCVTEGRSCGGSRICCTGLTCTRDGQCR